MNGSKWAENLLTGLYLDPRGKGTVPSGPNCVCRGESGANFDSELFVSGPQPVARGVARSRLGPTIYVYSCAHVWTTFITVQNLAGIDAVMSSIMFCE